MFNFFVDKDNVNETSVIIKDGDYNHLKNVLRMKVGDQVLISTDGVSNLCRIEKFEPDFAVLEIIEKNYSSGELPVQIYLFQGLPKSDKMELIIQKAVELGVTAIIPVQMSRSIVKIEEKKKGAKTERWQAIAESAGKQSKRSVIPKVYDVMSFDKALEFASETDLFLLPYENKNGMVDTKNALNKIKKGDKISVLVGPEGGFSDSEIDKALSNGANVISLGKRILRTETASILSVGMLMLHAETNL